MGADIAAQYVATQLEAMGLQPGGEQAGWFQKVSLRKAVNDASGSSLILSAEGKELKLRDGADYVAIADLSRPKPAILV